MPVTIRRLGLPARRGEVLRPCGPAALRPCGPAALRPCGPAALRPCGPAALRCAGYPHEGQRSPLHNVPASLCVGRCSSIMQNVPANLHEERCPRPAALPRTGHPYGGAMLTAAQRPSQPVGGDAPRVCIMFRSTCGRGDACNPAARQPAGAKARYLRSCRSLADRSHDRYPRLCRNPVINARWAIMPTTVTPVAGVDRAARQLIQLPPSTFSVWATT
jgi:hypothetical protein